MEKLNGGLTSWFVWEYVRGGVGKGGGWLPLEPPSRALVAGVRDNAAVIWRGLDRGWPPRAINGFSKWQEGFFPPVPHK